MMKAVVYLPTRAVITCQLHFLRNHCLSKKLKMEALNIGRDKVAKLCYDKFW